MKKIMYAAAIIVSSIASTHAINNTLMNLLPVASSLYSRPQLMNLVTRKADQMQKFVSTLEETKKTMDTLINENKQLSNIVETNASHSIQPTRSNGRIRAALLGIGIGTVLTWFFKK